MRPSGAEDCRSASGAIAIMRGLRRSLLE